MTKMRPGAKLPNQGFTLVEVMIAMIILSIGVLAVAGMASSSIKQVRRGFNLTNSTFAAQQVLDRYMMMPFDSIPTGNSADTISVGGQDYRVLSTITDVSATWSTVNSDVVYHIVVYAGGGVNQRNGERFETFVYNQDAL